MSPLFKNTFIKNLKSRHCGGPWEKFMDVYVSFVNLFNSYYWVYTVDQISEKGTSTDIQLWLGRAAACKNFNV